MKRYYVITSGQGNQPVQSPLKTWVRQNKTSIPPEINYTTPSNSLAKQLKNKLKGVLVDSSDQVLIVLPDKNGSINYADDLVADLEEDVIAENGREESVEFTFGLEKDLQKALRSNIGSLESGLEIIDNGCERNTIAGRIDITARDIDQKTVIIELKSIEAKADAIAQILSYMEAVKAEDRCDVRGILVAKEFTERVRLAAKQVPNLKLITYRFAFTFN